MRVPAGFAHITLDTAALNIRVAGSYRGREGSRTQWPQPVLSWERAAGGGGQGHWVLGVGKEQCEGRAKATAARKGMLSQQHPGRPLQQSAFTSPFPAAAGWIRLIPCCRVSPGPRGLNRPTERRWQPMKAYCVHFYISSSVTHELNRKERHTGQKPLCTGCAVRKQLRPITVAAALGTLAAQALPHLRWLWLSSGQAGPAAGTERLSRGDPVNPR